MSDRAGVVSAATAQIASGQFAQDLSELVAHPTESQNPARATELAAYLTEALIPRLARMGFDTQVHDNPHGPPFLTARRIENPTYKTVLLYGHGDVVHGQDADWDVGLRPFELTARDEKLYGRGAADNKAQHLINLLAMETVLSARGALGFNVIWLFEMGEEVGSPGLEQFCAAQRDLLSADVLIASDGPRLRPGHPTVFLGARGAINFDLTVALRDGAHHSGNWGGLLADPAMILVQALATITDARGQIQIDAWRPNSLTPDVRDMLGLLPDPGEGGPDIDADWGEAGLSLAERAYGWNSFTILAMQSGVPDAPVNAISASARATCQLRFVVGTDPDQIIPALRSHLDAAGFTQVDIDLDRGRAFPATRTDAASTWVQAVSQSVETTVGQPPDLLPNLAGSLPNHCFSEVLGLPTIWVPHSYGGCNQHAPNEHVLASVCEQALAVMAGLYWDLGTLETDSD